METLLAFAEMLASFGNWAFWSVSVLLFTVATLTMLFGKWDHPVSCFFLKGHPFLQKIARLSFVLILLLCPFMECDFFFHGLTHPVGKAICVYISVVIGFILMMGINWLIAAIILCISRVYYWIMDKKWPDDN